LRLQLIRGRSQKGPVIYIGGDKFKGFYERRNSFWAGGGGYTPPYICGKSFYVNSVKPQPIFYRNIEGFNDLMY
jgi:hypothetical protein